MPNAIITDHFRKSLISLLETEIKTTNTGKYWIGIGKSDKWTEITNVSGENNPPAPVNSVVDNEDIIHNLIALKKIEASGVDRLILKSNHDWTSGRTYKVYDPSDLTSFNHNVAAGGNISQYGCYAIAGATKKLYICLGNNSSTPSTSTPTGVASNYVYQFTNADNYIWAEVGTIETSGRFENSTTFNVLPTNGADNGATWSDGTALTKTGGLLYGFKIADAGAGYTASQTDISFKVRGEKVDGSAFEIAIEATSDTSGKLSAVTQTSNVAFDLVSFTSVFGTGGTSGVKFASVDYVSGGGSPTSTGKIIPLIAPSLGFGSGSSTNSNYALFPANYIGLAADFAVDDSADVRTDVSFRQVSLVYDPTRFEDNDNPATNDSMDSLQHINVTNGITMNVTDFSGYYLQATTGEMAWIDSVDSTNNIIYYHQNNEDAINLKPLSASSGEITIYDPTGASTGITIANSSYTLDNNTEHTRHTGTPLFVENRPPIRRSQAQKEEVRLILQL
tara:strand:+ start:207 stop:1724 length:1518 start_codon:yes stop_codon:yes gene_type:complete